MAQIRSLAQELPYAVGDAKKRRKKKKEKRKQKSKSLIHNFINKLHFFPRRLLDIPASFIEQPNLIAEIRDALIKFSNVYEIIPVLHILPLTYQINALA